MSRLRRWTVGWGTAMLTGAFAFVVGGRLGSAPLPGLAVGGALYGLAVLGLIRLFPVRGWGLPVAGLLCGPVPISLLAGRGGEPGERFGVALIFAGLGLLLGLLEWARQSRAESDAKGR